MFVLYKNILINITSDINHGKMHNKKYIA